MTGGCWWSRDMQPAISNKKTNQFFSLEWEELFVFICCGLRLPKRMQSRRKVKRIEKFLSFCGAKHEARQNSGKIGFALLVLILGGLWAGPPANAPHKRESNQTKQNQAVFSLLSLWMELEWMEVNDNGIQQRNEERAAPNQTKKERNEPRELIDFFVGYGRWPSCSAPIPLIFSFPIQRLISCCSPHASLLPLFFGAQPKKKSWNEDKLRQLNNKWKRGMIWRKWKQRREWSWVDWIENI